MHTHGLKLCTVTRSHDKSATSPCLRSCMLVRLHTFSLLQALFDLEATNQDFKTDLRDLYISSAQLIDVTPSKNAIIIHVPYRLLKGFQKIQQRLVRELEKKFSGKDVVLVANRRIMPKTKSGSSKARPRSRTLTSVRHTTCKPTLPCGRCVCCSVSAFIL